MLKDENNILENILNKNGLALSDEIFQKLLEVVQAETLGNKVARAHNQRSQGHFDKAMLNISEANRDQVLSIRKIQLIIDKTKGTPKTEVIFEKYRPFYPFQIGLANGEDVLELMRSIKHECDFALEDRVAKLHEYEKIFDPLLEELSFYETRMKGRISENEITNLNKNVEKNRSKILEIKASIFDHICRVVQEVYSQIATVDKIALVINAFLILTSSIQTLDAKFVEVEQGAKV